MISIVNTLEEERWRRFVDEQPGGNIFHTPEMFRVFSRARGHQPRLWAAVNQQGDPLALLLPVEVTVLNRLLRPLTTRAVVYGGVLTIPGPEGEAALELLLRTYRQAVGGRILFTELRHLADASRFKGLLEGQRFAHEDHLNYLIDLKRSEEAVFQSFQHRLRSAIRRGLKKQALTIVETINPAQLSDHYALLARTYSNARVPLAAPSLFQAVFDELHPKGMVWFTLACLGDTPVANSIELVYKEVVYGWYGGLDRSYAAYSPTELLLWRLLQRGVQEGYAVYDFGGAGKPDEPYGVRDFKAKFGGQLVCYGRSVCTHAPVLLKLSRLGYKLYQRVR